MKKWKFPAICAAIVTLVSCSSSSSPEPSFGYDLHFSSTNEICDKAVICFHGLGGDYRVSHTVEPFFKGKASVISFNFPDHGKHVGTFNPEDTVFGTIQEILPALYVLKKVVLDDGYRQVCLYGFSAGAAALINCISTLNTSTYDTELSSIGIGKEEKQILLQIVQQGDIILDTPLKSIDELVSLYGMTRELEVIGRRYRENGMDPILSLCNWNNLSLNVLVHFEIPDEVVSNQEDERFMEILKKHNRGSCEMFVGTDAGHNLPHLSMWRHHLLKCRCF